MDYASKLGEYGLDVAAEAVAAEVARARAEASRNENNEVYKLCYSAIDLTQLNVTDSERHIAEFTKKTVAFPGHFPDIPNVASICVYPLFVDTVALAAGDGGLTITSVAGGFPSSQTYLEVKMLEVAMAVENGADEVDVVINVGQLLDGQYDALAGEIETIRNEMGSEVILKVIVESGALKAPRLIRTASLLAMLAGADFVKTSTGKIDIAATPEAAVVMCTAIKDYYARTGRRAGFKAAGGVKTAEDAALYYTIVENILGPEWCTPALFRIGASSAANNILSTITGREVKYY
ncbi:MAG: deoxyribose-phosphate aldolase [Rikenellaceae bacterium]|jgi:deoxyribose-phosphate aldolase|nr:deoxyribose-phosphate aldolase [Rikenellaceae bacterium]